MRVAASFFYSYRRECNTRKEQRHNVSSAARDYLQMAKVVFLAAVRVLHLTVVATVRSMAIVRTSAWKKGFEKWQYLLRWSRGF